MGYWQKYSVGTNSVPVLWRGLLSVITLVFLVQPASARCGRPKSLAMPTTGSTIPSSSQVFVYVSPHWVDKKSSDFQKLTVSGGSAKVTLRHHSDAWAVLQVDIRAKADSVSLSWDGKPLATYQVGTPNIVKPVLGKATRHRHKWTCSFTDMHTVKIKKGSAIGYLVRIGSKSAPEHVVPPYPMPGGYRKVSPEIRLGHVNCTGHTIPASPGKTVHVWSVHVDGSIQYLGKVYLPK